MTPRDATWLAAAREARGYTYQSDAIRALARRGIKVDPSTFSAWESGARKPKPSNRTYRAVVDFFGEDAQQQESPADATPAGLSALLAFQAQLVVAFETQAEAVMALVEEMRLARAEDVKTLQEQVDFARAERNLLTERVAAIERDHAVLRERVG